MTTKLYLAGSLFTTAEREFNALLARALEWRGYEVWLPQEHEPREFTARAIFDEDVKGMDWSDITVANMDGPDPDSGTCFEVGYTYARRKPVVCYRTDFRNVADFPGSDYNLMLTQSATKLIKLNALHARVDDVADEIAKAIEEIRAEKRAQHANFHHTSDPMENEPMGNGRYGYWRD